MNVDACLEGRALYPIYDNRGWQQLTEHRVHRVYGNGRDGLLFGGRG